MTNAATSVPDALWASNGEKRPTLTVAVATMGHRLHQLTLPVPHPGVDYLITVQQPDPQTSCAWTDRSDVTVLETPTLGLSENRNLGLDAAAGALVLFSDDDVVLTLEGVDRIRMAFAVDPALTLAAGWRAGRLPQKGRRAGPHALNRLNSGRICAPEFVVRKEIIQKHGLRFDTDFGVGARYPVGEDYVFVTDILRAGLQGKGLSVIAGGHDGDSTGDDWQDPAVIKARAHVLARVFGIWAGPVRLLYAARHARRFETRTGAVRFAVFGRV